MIKKILPLFLLLFSLNSAHAQNETRWTIGARAGAFFGNFANTDEYLNLHIIFSSNLYPVNEESDANFAVAIYGGYTIFKGLSVQLEFDFFINQNATVRWDGLISGLPYSFKATSFYTSLDIPILLRYSFRDKPLLGVEAGPYLSIPLGKFKYYRIASPLGGTPGEQNAKSSAKLGFGMAVGVFTGFRLGPGRITGNIRYIFNFTPVNAGVLNYMTELIIMDVFSRRGIIMMLGYEYSF